MSSQYKGKHQQSNSIVIVHPFYHTNPNVIEEDLFPHFPQELRDFDLVSVHTPMYRHQPSPAQNPQQQQQQQQQQTQQQTQTQTHAHHNQHHHHPQQQLNHPNHHLFGSQTQTLGTATRSSPSPHLGLQAQSQSQHPQHQHQHRHQHHLSPPPPAIPNKNNNNSNHIPKEPPSKKQKRPRALLACRACRSRKAKCERNSLDEQCTTCIRLGIPCIDEHSAAPSAKSSHSTPPLQTSHNNNSSSQSPPVPVPAPAPPQTHSQSTPTRLLPPPPPHNTINPALPPPPPSVKFSNQTPSSHKSSSYSTSKSLSPGLYSSGDAMGALSAWKEEDDSNRSYDRPFFGPSSALIFLDRVRSVIMSLSPGKDSLYLPANGTDPTSSLDDSTIASKTDLKQDPNDDVTATNNKTSNNNNNNNSNSNHNADPNSTHNYQQFMSSPQNMYALPPRDIADNLVYTFLIASNSVLHVLHAPTFMAEYELLWSNTASNKRPPDTKFLALVNMAFATATLFSPTLSESVSENFSDAETYFNRARQLLSLNLFEDSSIRTVQVLILISHYGQSMASPSRCWNALGLAARIAIGLGLHHDSSTCTALDPLVIQERRRAYWACVNLDIVHSMTLGRPGMIAHIPSTVDLPLDIDDEYISPHTISPQPPGTPSSTTLFVQTIKLYQILYNVLTQLYFPRDIKQGSNNYNSYSSSYQHNNYNNNYNPHYEPYLANETESLQAMLALESKLDEWRAQVPHHLAIGVDTSNDYTKWPWVARHKHILYVRYMNVRTLLFRPSLTSLLSCDTPSNNLDASILEATSFRDRLSRLAASICLESAKAQIDALYNTTTSQAGAPWYSTLYIYTSCGVLLASQWNGTIDSSVFDLYWHRSREVLLRYVPNYPSTERALRVLDVLRNQLLEISSINQDITSHLDQILGTELDPFGTLADLWPWRSSPGPGP